MKRILSIILFTISISLISSASGLNRAKEKLYVAYISGDHDLWVEIMNDLRISYENSRNIFILFELAKSQYGYMGSLIDRSQFEKAKSILPEAEKNINKLIEYNESWTDVHGLKAGIYGFKIILYPNQVILNGPKGKVYLNKATSLGDLTPSVLVEMANYKYHTPNILGGDIDEAIQYYELALKLFELTNQSENNWQYLNTMVWLAISLDRKGESNEAKKILQRLLQKEPDFKWVKNSLYPKVVKNESISKIYYSSNN